MDEGWEATRLKLEERWPVLTRGELLATRGSTELLDAMLHAKLGYAQRLVAECLPEPPRKSLVQHLWR